MPDSTRISAHDILSVPINRPERLFTSDAAKARREFKSLARIWHPDHNADTNAHAVFSHLKTLYEVAKARLENGAWQGRGSTLLRTPTGRAFRLRHLARAPFELGEMLLADSVVAYRLKPEHAEPFEHAREAIARLRFADADMEREMAPRLPRPRRAFETADGEHVLVLEKTPDLIRLADIVEHCGGAIDSRQAAWIIGCCLSLACYLGWAGVAHNAISTDTLFVSPQQHTTALLGGWWHAAPLGGPWLTAPRSTVDVTPVDLLAARSGDVRVDLACIRALGRTMLGDPGGALLRDERILPRPLADWLNLPSSGDALTDYDDWQQALTDAFGPRRFVPWPLSAGDIYR